MARLNISTGTAANDGTGDTLRSAGEKINANFRELYTTLGGDSGSLTSGIELTGSRIVWEGSAVDAHETHVGVINSTADRYIYFPNNDGHVILDSASQTLTNKTLTTPIIASISNSGTITIPTGTDTLIGRATTDTVYNKTMAHPQINDAAIGSKFVDSNANELIKFTKAGSAVNEITIGNAATGDNALIKGTGETNIGIDLQASGTGTINLKSPISGDCEVLTGAGAADVSKPLTMVNAGSPVNVTLAAGAVTGQSKKFLNVGTGVASIKPTVMNFGDTVAMTRWSSCEMIWIDSSLASGVGAGWHLLGGADSGDAAITISG
tara:strand:+ start:735 stop:1703 length:969 start_codon:yes stop_codon:yes gene_type:complete